jgi:hypothetical protein
MWSVLLYAKYQLIRCKYHNGNNGNIRREKIPKTLEYFNESYIISYITQFKHSESSTSRNTAVTNIRKYQIYIYIRTYIRDVRLSSRKKEWCRRMWIGGSVEMQSLVIWCIKESNKSDPQFKTFLSQWQYWMIGQIMNRELKTKFKVSTHGLIWGTILIPALKDWGKPREALVTYRKDPSHDSNQALPGCKPEALLLEPICMVQLSLKF